MTPDYEHIQYEVERRRARVTLSRPAKHNAISPLMEQELEEALFRADDDTSVHSIILRGAGPSFCAGYDLSYFGDRTIPRGDRRGRAQIDDNAWHLEQSQRHLRAFSDTHKPIIAQVHGHCLAGGTGLALFCDMVIAADDATFGFPAGRAGTLPNLMWLYHAGPQWTKRLLLTGDSVTGSEAAQLGLVMKAVPSEWLEYEVEALADRFAAIDADLLSAGKRIVNIGLELMGAGTLQRLAAEMDARAHLAATSQSFQRQLAAEGVRNAYQARDAAFGDGRARVQGPEVRDDTGHLIAWEQVRAAATAQSESSPS